MELVSSPLSADQIDRVCRCVRVMMLTAHEQRAAERLGMRTERGERREKEKEVRGRQRAKERVKE